MALRRNSTPHWRKSTWSTSGNCVETAALLDSVLMRDTKANGAGPVLRVSPDEWTRFVTSAKDGEFDL